MDEPTFVRQPYEPPDNQPDPDLVAIRLLSRQVLRYWYILKDCEQRDQQVSARHARYFWDKVARLIQHSADYSHRQLGGDHAPELYMIWKFIACDLATGRINKSMKAVTTRGRNEYSPWLMEQIKIAVFYVRLADVGLIKDLTPRQTVEKYFGEGASRLRSWLKDLADEKIPARYVEFPHYLEEVLEEAGEIYRAGGSSHEAIRLRDPRTID